MKPLRPIVPETCYPISFRSKDAHALATYIKRRESVCLVAMKKMGIANFCRFFCFHPEVRKTYFVEPKNSLLFVYCDLNCLRELTERAFYQYVTKTLTSTIAESNLSQAIKSDVASLIGSDPPGASLQESFDRLVHLVTLVASRTNVILVLFLVRFDRLQSLFHSLFFAALQSLSDVARFRLLYVITSVRPLKDFYRTNISDSEAIFFPQSYVLKPIAPVDLRSIEKHLNFTQAYDQGLTDAEIQTIFTFGGGHIMLTRLILMARSEHALNGSDTSLTIPALLDNERIRMACEEIWENLTKPEKQFLMDTVGKKATPLPDRSVQYLMDTGILTHDRHSWSCFSPLFSEWVRLRQRLVHEIKQATELTRKEEQLLAVLQVHAGDTCDRDQIIEAVWPEYEQIDLTVSDWAIDRLVARLRSKMKHQNDHYELITVRGKGFKLVTL